MGDVGERWWNDGKQRNERAYARALDHDHGNHRDDKYHYYIIYRVDYLSGSSASPSTRKQDRW